MGASELSGQPDKIAGGFLRWTSIPSRGSSHTPSRFMLWKLELRQPDKPPYNGLGGCKRGRCHYIIINM